MSRTRLLAILTVALAVSCMLTPCANGAAVPRTAKVVEGNTAFALELYKRLKAEDGNLFFSPYSVSTAFAMTHAGARGNTEKQMSEVLRFTPNQRDLHAAFGKIESALNAVEKKGDVKLSVANALWGQDGYSFRQDFLDLTQKSYGAGLRVMDFVRQAEPSRQRINQWVEDQTNRKITNLLPRGSVNGDTRLVLTNAIYFKGNWFRQFKKRSTRDQPFRLKGGGTVQAPLMYQRERFGYAQRPGLQVLEMDYKGKELSMVVLLPGKHSDIARIERDLTPARLKQWTTRLGRPKVHTYFPKFKTTSKFMLGKALSDMGMKDAFTAGVADFSGMDGTRKLSISAAVHKAFVEVNEEGTEAAAATGVVVGVTSMPMNPITFRADRPFLFLIRHKPTGSLLFMGRIMDPTK